MEVVKIKDELREKWDDWSVSVSNRSPSPGEVFCREVVDSLQIRKDSYENLNAESMHNYLFTSKPFCTAAKGADKFIRYTTYVFEDCFKNNAELRVKIGKILSLRNKTNTAKQKETLVKYCCNEYSRASSAQSINAFAKTLSYGEDSSALINGELYQLQNNIHTWPANLSWLLAHLHKKHFFIVTSEIIKPYEERVTETHKKQLSGFAREVALLCKEKYTLDKDGRGRVIFKPPKGKEEIENLEALSLSDVCMNEHDTRRYYSEACDLYRVFCKKKDVLVIGRKSWMQFMDVKITCDPSTTARQPTQKFG